MIFREKVDAFVREAEAEGIPRWNLAPPVYRLFWWLGLEIPPPTFLPGRWVALLEGSFFALIFGVLFFQFFSFQETVFCALGTGFMFGLVGAIQHYDMIHQVGSLPSWDRYLPGVDASADRTPVQSDTVTDYRL